MCKFCKEKKNGIVLSHKDYTFGESGEITSSVMLHLEDEPSIDFDADCGSGSLIYHEVEIKYCPFCGRKLE